AEIWRFMKSSNAGSTWSEISGTGHPSTLDAFYAATPNFSTNTEHLTIEVTNANADKLYCLIDKYVTNSNPPYNVLYAGEIWIHDFSQSSPWTVVYNSLTNPINIYHGEKNGFCVNP